MEKAIKRAIEGGYKATWDKVCGAIIPIADGCNNVGNQFALLDPLFWEALGKAEGWGSFYEYSNNTMNKILPIWEVNWHEFIHHLADGKDAEEFFSKLLK